MIKQLACLVVILSFFAGPVEAKPLPNVDQRVDAVMRNTVVLTVGESPFCSGVVGMDPSNKTYLYTAQHCCAFFLRNGTEGNRFIQKTNGDRIALKGELEDYGRADICRVRVLNYGHTNTKIAVYHGERDLMLVSAFPPYSYSERVSRLMVIGRSLDNDLHLIASGQVFAGESGSPIINEKGEVVAFAIAHYPQAPYPNVIISILSSQ